MKKHKNQLQAKNFIEGPEAARRFESTLKAILSVPKSEVLALERKRKNRLAKG